MKKLNLFLLLLVGLSSCNKKDIVELKFDVISEKPSYKVGDPVNFIISGNPDQITFFSGEEGHKYIYKDRVQAESDKITLEFATNRRYGTDALQPQSFRLMASQTFNGKYDAANIIPAEWVDITPAFTLSGIASNDDAFVNSGVVNLTTLSSLGFTLDKNKPVYFAFKYTGVKNDSAQPRWWVNKFDIKTTTLDGQILPVANIGTVGWTYIKTLASSPVNFTYTSNQLRYQGSGINTPDNRVWAVTSGLSLTKVQPDAGVALKNMSTRMDNYAYKFTTPGTYNVTFIASNVNVYAESKTVKEVQVVITP